MSRLRGFLLGVALALPLAAIGGTDDASVIGKASVTTVDKADTMTSIQKGPASDRCCWVFYLGMWFCFVC